MKTSKTLKRIFLTLSTIGVFLTSFYLFVYRGNNRMSVWYNHGLWLPKTTTDINFRTYPDFIVYTDDWSISNCIMPKKEFQELIENLEWCDWCYGIGTHYQTPDSLKNKYPMKSEFKSPIGDFLIISAIEMDSKNVDVYLYTDWN